ncbi:MAG: substrate-binding domain-containing protein [Chloroflexi bacterium]|nr:substrate-binding domain-containing protein [Chloroflexota bacterium]
MNKNMNRRDFLKTLGMTGGAALLVGCAKAPEVTAAPQATAAPQVNANEKYVMVSNVAAHPYWLDAQYGGEDAAKMLGVTWQYTGPAEFDTPAQVTALEQIISTKPAGLLVAALQPDAISAAIDKAIAAGIPVVTVDTDAPDSKRMTYLGTANYSAGVTMGKTMMEALGGKGKVGLASVPGQFNLEERIRGIKDAFAATNGAMELVTVVDDKNDDAATTDAVVAMLQANPDINLVGSINAVGAGVAAALRQTNNVGKIKAVTFDITEPIIAALEDGSVNATMVQRTYMMTFVGVQMLYDYNHRSAYLENWSKNGIGVLPYAVDTGVMSITKEKAAAFKKK